MSNIFVAIIFVLCIMYAKERNIMSAKNVVINNKEIEVMPNSMSYSPRVDKVQDKSCESNPRVVSDPSLPPNTIKMVSPNGDSVTCKKLGEIKNEKKKDEEGCMTDRLKGLVIVLEHDTREDDCNNIINAISMIKGVESVEKNVRDVDDFMSRNKIKRELLEKISKIFYDE